MRKMSIQGRVIELSDYAYYNQWIGIILLTGRLGGLLGGFFDMHDKNGNILDNHSSDLYDNLRLVEDPNFRTLLDEFARMYMQVVSLDHEAVAKLAQLLGMAEPQTPQDYRLLYRKSRNEDHQINAHGLLSHPAFDELQQRFLQTAEEISVLKEKLLEYILTVYPDAARSEYLLSR